jgi:hypothetical protein
MLILRTAARTLNATSLAAVWTSDYCASAWASSCSLPIVSASKESAFGSSDDAACGAAAGCWRWFLRLRGLAASEPELGLESLSLSSATHLLRSRPLSLDLARVRLDLSKILWLVKVGKNLFRKS